MCSISSTVKLSRLPLTSFRKPCCLRLSISGDSWEAKVWDQHDQRKGRITSGSCGWKRFTDCSIPYALSRDHQPSDINSVPTCPKQNWSTTSTLLTTLTTRISVPFLPFLPSPTPLCLPASNSAWRFGQKAKHLPWPPKTRKIWSEAISKILTKPYDRHAFLEPEIIWIIYESWASNDIGTLCHTRETQNKNRDYNLGGNLAVHPLLGKRFQILWLLNHAFRSLKGATKSKTHNSMERKTKSSSLRVLPKCSESVQGVRSILVQRCTTSAQNNAHFHATEWLPIAMTLWFAMCRAVPI